MRLISHLLALPLALLPTLAQAATDLSVSVTRPVDCIRKSKNGDKLVMNYKGTLEKDGSQFDSSYDRGQPFKFKLGAGQVIAGWDQGLTDMCPGEGRKLVIPPGLAYGNDAMGSIPAASTLVFEVELVEIMGVNPEPKPSPGPAETSEASKPTQLEDIPAASHAVTDVASTTAALSAATGTSGAQSSPLDGEKGDDECNLLGDFALFVQGALGLLAVSSLAVKRWREHPRRPVKIWFFDASKQVFGSVLLHGANVLMSMLSSGKFDVAAKTSVAAGKEGDQPNPCSFYLLNLAIDTTIGIPILVLLLKVLYRGALLTPLANPPESIRSGNYGQPPRATWWLKQSVIYFCGLLLMKLCVLAIFAFLPWIAWVGDWALRWTEGNTAVQITFVMFIFPLIMNALQYWIIDNFIKDPEHGGEGGYEGVGDSDEDEESDDEWLERQQRRREQGIDDEDEDVEAVAVKPLEEAIPTLVPVRSKAYDPEIDGAASRK